MLNALRSVALLLTLIPAFATGLFAQIATETLFREDFDSLALQSSPERWVDHEVGILLPDTKGSFRVAADPLNPANHVYAFSAPRPRLVTQQSSRPNEPARIGEFSLIDRPFFPPAVVRLRGRILAGSPQSLAGITLYSSYPGSDEYYLAGLWPQESTGRRTFQVFSHGTGTLQGLRDSNIAAEPDRWYRFAIELTDDASATRIRARFWPEGSAEPANDAIAVEDRSNIRLRHGRFGVWAARGPAFFDDLVITSEYDASKLRIQVLESGSEIGDGAKFNRDVQIEIRVSGGERPSFEARLNGALFTSNSLVSSEGQHRLDVTARDARGQTTQRSIGFLLDKTPPNIRFTSHQANAVLRSNRVILSGDADDAVQVLVAGLPATIDSQRRFTSTELGLQDGLNTVSAAGTDEVGNIARIEIPLVVNAGPVPQLTMTSPVSNACLSGNALLVTGTWFGAQSIDVTVGSVTFPATLNVNWTWSATVVDPPEGRRPVVATARGSSGLTAEVSVHVTIDRTAPLIEVTESGSPFAGGLLNRAVAPVLRVIDSDPAATLSVTKDGKPFTSGAIVEAEGHHRIEAVGRDCAGHETQRIVEFDIDRTAPALSELTPASDGAVGKSPVTIRGRTAPDAVSVEIEGTTFRATPDPTGVFAIADVTLAEGNNTFTIRATDRAGNHGSTIFRLRLDSNGPGVEILVDGSPVLPIGTMFNRQITPVIRSNDTKAEISATLNGTPYTIGTAIGTDGQYELIATAKNSLGNSSTARASFRIDTVAPVVKITTPSAGLVPGERVNVTGTSTDAVQVTVNGLDARIEAGVFTFTGLPLDLDETVITAVGFDAAGNAGQDRVTVMREPSGPAILLLFPPDGSLTSRNKTDVIGQVLSPAPDDKVDVTTSSGWNASARVDPNGRFQVPNVPLEELDNEIAVTAPRAGGLSTTVRAKVTADFTPPRLAILESGQPFSDGARVPQSAVLSFETSDLHEPLRAELFVDGTKIAVLPVTV